MQLITAKVQKVVVDFIICIHCLNDIFVYYFLFKKVKYFDHTSDWIRYYFLSVLCHFEIKFGEIYVLKVKFHFEYEMMV